MAPRRVGCGARGVRLSKQKGANAPRTTWAGRPTRLKQRQASRYDAVALAVYGFGVGV